VAARRRGRGKGSIYRRKDGRWVGQYEVGGKRRYVYGKTREDVAARLAKAVADGNEGLVFDSDQLTVAQYVDAPSSYPGWQPLGSTRSSANGHSLPAEARPST